MAISGQKHTIPFEISTNFGETGNNRAERPVAAQQHFPRAKSLDVQIVPYMPQYS